MSEPFSSNTNADDTVKLFSGVPKDEISQNTNRAAEFESVLKQSASAAEETISGAYSSIEKYVKENPIQVAAGAAAVGALVVLVLSQRSAKERSMQRKLSRDLSRYASDLRQTVQTELRNIDPNAGMAAISRIIPEQDIKRLVGPWLEELTKSLASARDGLVKVAKSATG